MGGKGDTSPDKKTIREYGRVAEEQSEADRRLVEAQTWANRPTQNTPWGTVDWSNEQVWDPSTEQFVNQWTQDVTLTPEEQESLDAQQRIGLGKSELAESQIGRVEDAYASAPNWDELGEYGEFTGRDVTGDLDFSGAHGVGDPDRYRADAESAIYEQGASRLDPQWEQRQQAAEVRLRSQGLSPGDEAYDTAMANLGRERTDAYNQLGYQSFLGGGAEADRTLTADMARRGMDVGETTTGAEFGREGELAQTGIDETTANYANQLRQQQIAEMAMERGMSLNEMNAILHGTQVGMPSMPGFNTATKSEGPQYLEARKMADQSALDQYNAKASQMQGMLTGLTGAATGAGNLGWKPFG